MSKIVTSERNQLFGAARAGDEITLSYLLNERRMTPDLRDRYGVTPLMEACETGQLASVELLVEAGAEVNATDKETSTVLMHACGGASTPKIVQYLIDHGALVNERDASGCTALTMAAAHGDVGIVRALLAAKADVNAESDEQETPLTFAVVWGHLEVVRALVDAGADVKWTDDKQWTPLRYAIFEENWEIANLLQECGANLADAPSPVGKRAASAKAKPRKGRAKK